MADFILVDSESHGKVLINKEHIILVVDLGDGTVSIALTDIEAPIIVKQSLKFVKESLE